MNSQFEMPGMDLMGGVAGVGMGLLVGFLIVFLLLTLGVCIAVYVFQSLSCYTIAKRRGIHNPWLAWIPVGNVWILGSISDQFQYVKKGKIRNRRKVLLWLTIAMYVLSVPTLVSEIGVVTESVVGNGTAAGGAAVLMAICSFVVSALTIAGTVIQYIAYYDLYSSCQPNNSVLYLVLSIIFSITLPIFLFICRNKDEGMPPRRQAAPAQVLEEVIVQPVVPEEPAEEAVVEAVNSDEVTDADFVNEEE